MQIYYFSFVCASLQYYYDSVLCVYGDGRTFKTESSMCEGVLKYSVFDCFPAILKSNRKETPLFCFVFSSNPFSLSLVLY